MVDAVTHLEKVITGEVSAVTHLEKVIAEETTAVTYTEKVIAGEAPPITHLQRVIAGVETPVTHLEHVWAGGTPTPTEHEYTGAVPYTFTADGTPLLDWYIKGNTVQNGTPTPSAPIAVNGVGTLDSGDYKIPISSGDTTTNLYLGSTQTTRKITKYTFTGNETTFSCVATTDGQNYCVVYRFIDFGMTDIKDFDKIMQDIDYPIFISSHFVEKTNHNSDFNDIKSGEVGANTVSAAGNRYIIFCVSGLTTAAEYSAWFAQQYANGTPVEVYYILETETTGIVNEPLRKIGDYVDTLTATQSGVSIPTNNGSNTLDVDTTLKPSEVYIKYMG